MGLGGLGPPRSQRVARVRAETGQGTVAQMGTPVCMHSNLDLGKTALIKHRIELTDWTPFKELLLMHTPTYV